MQVNHLSLCTVVAGIEATERNHVQGKRGWLVVHLSNVKMV